MSDYKWYGHFSDNGYKYVITEPETPRHWYNYMYNDDYITFTSQVGFGEGFAQDDMGRRVQLIINRNIFICEDEAWSIMGLPIGYGYTDYSCTHKAGSTVISLKYNEIQSSWRVFVPNNGKLEIWSVSLKNLSGKDRTVKLIPYAKTNIDAP
jgi:cellobiose phosphorylase